MEKNTFKIESFGWFYNREKDKPCLIAGTAPTINNFPFKTFNGIYITVNDGPIRFKKLFNPNYWVNANYEYPVPEKHLKDINSFKKTVFIFADSVTYSYTKINPEFLDKNLKVRWFAYDQRHFNHSKCQIGNFACCEILKIYPDRITIQEYIQKKFNTEYHYSTASTVSIHALAFAIIMGCNPIYIHGVELPYYKEDYKHYTTFNYKCINAPNYFKKFVLKVINISSWLRFFKRKYYELFIIKDKKQKKIYNEKIQKSSFYDDIPEIIKDFEYLVNLAKKLKRDIYILSKTSTLNEIDSLEYKLPDTIY